GRVRLALLHRRLSAGMALSALTAFAAGAGLDAPTGLAFAALAVPLFWLPSPATSARIEQATRVGVLALCAWTVHVAFVQGRDFMPAVLGMLLFLLVAESLRSADAKNDLRLYSLAFSLLIASTAFYPGLAFAAAFVAYVAFTTLAMMVGWLRRQAEAFRVADVPIGRRFLWTTAALSGVTLLMSALLFVLFPRLPRQWNVQGRPGGAPPMAGFSDEVTLGQHGGRISPSPDVMFRVEFPDGPPPRMEAIHWRGRAFDHFDGTRWSFTRRAALGDHGAPTYAVRWGGPFRQARIFGGPPGAPVLFGPHPVVNVTPRSAIRTYRDAAGDLVYFNSDNPVYTVTWADARPSDADLRAAEGTPDFLPVRRYRQLPPLSPRVRALADSLTAGRESRIDQARAIERYLQTELRYTLDLPATARDATVEGFLFRRREGHCEYFSTAMAVLLRARGIPARNVTGFLGGEWNENGGYLAVTGNDAHSWVEVWFPHYGWMTFDPTPPGRTSLVDGGETGWTWPARLWIDGVEYRWHKWVVDYNLDKQIALFRGVGDLFSRDSRGGSSVRGTGGGGGGFGGAAPWVIGAVLLAGGVWAFRGRRRAKVSPEARAYLALRRAYAKAGYAPRDGTGPLDFAETLARGGAPGASAAARTVDLYVRARFAREEIGEAGREEIAASTAEARAELKRARRGRKRRRGVPAGV
ncbi:MAG TPA: DUF3488 and transglutaminase-like domain-containing protein, partial [Longimicrobium sp.]|nr:DUF3488 and transglutaminase-like domain-containing protein [Longimicrobium sp.]